MNHSIKKLLSIATVLCGIVTSYQLPVTSWAGNSELRLPNSELPPEPYKSLFKDADKLRRYDGFFDLYEYGEKLYLEVPKELLGRELLLSSLVTNSSELFLVGKEVAPRFFFKLESTDSLVLVKEVKTGVLLDPENGFLSEALAASKQDATLMAFPIEKRSKGRRGALLFDATSLLSPTSDKLFNPKGMSYSGFRVSIQSFRTDAGKSYRRELKSYSGAISVKNTVTAKLTTTQLGLRSSELSWDTFEYTAFLSLLPSEPAPVRFAHPEVGTRNVLIDDYRDPSKLEKRQIVSRPRFTPGRPLVYYVDTLLPEPYQKVAFEAVKEWSDALASLGLSERLEAKLFPKGDGFDAEDPAINTITFSQNPNASTTSFNLTDPRSGEIISSRITIGKGVYNTLRTLGLIRISSVDERYRDYFLSPEVITEPLKNYLLKNVGRTLGLTTNLAGSMAYSPEELRDPEFTRTKGLSASIMDDLLFNGMARPGDRERGVKLVNDVIGTADKLALQYLYTPVPDGADADEYLDEMVKVHYGDPEYRFLQTTLPRMSDPRGQFNDISDDPIASTHNRLEQSKYIFAHITEWLEGDEVSSEYKSDLPAQLFSEVYFNTLQPLLSYIGGVYSDGRATPTGEQSYRPVPKEVQREIVHTFLSEWQKIDWINANRTLLDYSGAAPNMTNWAIEMGMPMKQLLQRLPNMDLSIKLAEEGDEPYTQDDFLTDVEAFLFSETEARQPLSAQSFELIDQYIEGLVSNSGPLKFLARIPLKSRTAIVELGTPNSELRTPNSDMPDVNATAITNIPYYVETDLTPIIFKHLELTRDHLRRAMRLSRGDRERTKADFFITRIDQIIGR